ncbi:unnamed protein product [Amoebophrya sp. A25]|nr:unnamed protein product [Amoebophrya sp. A25]|eukprot:GSA25T00013350001.1
MRTLESNGMAAILPSAKMKAHLVGMRTHCQLRGRAKQLLRSQCDRIIRYHPRITRTKIGGRRLHRLTLLGAAVSMQLCGTFVEGLFYPTKDPLLNADESSEQPTFRWSSGSRPFSPQARSAASRTTSAASSTFGARDQSDYEGNTIQQQVKVSSTTQTLVAKESSGRTPATSAAAIREDSRGRTPSTGLLIKTESDEAPTRQSLSQRMSNNIDATSRTERTRSSTLASSTSLQQSRQIPVQLGGLSAEDTEPDHARFWKKSPTALIAISSTKTETAAAIESSLFSTSTSFLRNIVFAGPLFLAETVAPLLQLISSTSFYLPAVMLLVLAYVFVCARKMNIFGSSASSSTSISTGGLNPNCPTTSAPRGINHVVTISDDFSRSAAVDGRRNIDNEEGLEVIEVAVGAADEKKNLTQQPSPSGSELLFMKSEIRCKLKLGGGASASNAVKCVEDGRVHPVNEGRLVYVTGESETGDVLTDDVFGSAIQVKNAMRLTRTVEMLQWVRRDHVCTTGTSNAAHARALAARIRSGVFANRDGSSTASRSNAQAATRQDEISALTQQRDDFIPSEPSTRPRSPHLSEHYFVTEWLSFPVDCSEFPADYSNPTFPPELLSEDGGLGSSTRTSVAQTLKIDEFELDFSALATAQSQASRIAGNHADQMEGYSSDPDKDYLREPTWHGTRRATTVAACGRVEALGRVFEPAGGRFTLRSGSGTVVGDIRVRLEKVNCGPCSVVGLQRGKNLVPFAYEKYFETSQEQLHGKKTSIPRLKGCGGCAFLSSTTPICGAWLSWASCGQDVITDAENKQAHVNLLDREEARRSRHRPHPAEHSSDLNSKGASKYCDFFSIPAAPLLRYPNLLFSTLFRYFPRRADIQMPPLSISPNGCPLLSSDDNSARGANRIDTATTARNVRAFSALFVFPQKSAPGSAASRHRSKQPARTAAHSNHLVLRPHESQSTDEEALIARDPASPSPGCLRQSRHEDGGTSALCLEFSPPGDGGGREPLNHEVFLLSDRRLSIDELADSL